MIEALLYMAVALSMVGASAAWLAFKYAKAIHQRDVIHRAFNARYGLYEKMPTEVVEVPDQIEGKK